MVFIFDQSLICLILDPSVDLDKLLDICDSTSKYFFDPPLVNHTVEPLTDAWTR